LAEARSTRLGSEEKATLWLVSVLLAKSFDYPMSLSLRT